MENEGCEKLSKEDISKQLKCMKTFRLPEVLARTRVESFKYHNEPLLWKFS